MTQRLTPFQLRVCDREPVLCLSFSSNPAPVPHASSQQCDHRVTFPKTPFSLLHMPSFRTLLVLFFLTIASFVQMSAQITLNPLPTRVIGQDSTTITTLAPNLVEGREFFTPEAVALDTTTNPPSLYVADTSNNRVLGFHSATGFANGQKADIVIGQPDFVTTFAAGPGTTHTTGLTGPTGLAVDAHGNLYVLDSGNNRILRFPQPFAQPSGIIPDLVVGQPNFSTNVANQGGLGPATLSFVGSSKQVLLAFLTFDPSGDLWVADAGNNRVLRFNVSALGSQPLQGPSADIVLGQPDFLTNTYNPPADPQTSLITFTTPTGIAFDSKGRLFVSESISTRRSRILEWNPPFFSSVPAARLLGVDENIPQPPTISELQLLPSTGGLFPVGDGMGIADTQNNRLLVFPPVEQWVANQTYQAAVEVAGQPDFSSGAINQGDPTAGPGTLSSPNDAFFFNNELYIADSLNNRVIVVPQNGTSFGPGTRVLGQDLFTLNAPNLVEGREFDFVSSAGNLGDAGIAVDLSSNPPHLYVADPYNNRVLGYNDLRNIKPGQKADIVIGQPDFQQILINYPTNNPNQPNASGLYHPVGVIVDTVGNLYVADSGNGRVLRFPAPFTNYSAGTISQADIVLGQQNFTSTIPDPTPRTMAAPYGVVFAHEHGLLVSDIAHNRVLLFPGTYDTFTSGEAASLVFGQPDFNSSAAGSAQDQLNSPRHIAVDSDDRLYVADTGNGRVQIFDHAPTASPDPTAAYSLTSGLRNPAGIYVSDLTGEIWVADASSQQASRFADFTQLVAGHGTANATISDQLSPRAVVEDAWGNLFLADTGNRVIIYYPGLGALNDANYLNENALAPGMITAVYSTGNYQQFGGQATVVNSLPLPTTLNGVQVLFNGSPAPLYYADPNQINFQVPMAAPQSGTADLQVLEAATGRILGDTTVSMNPSIPGLFTQTATGSGTVAALNQDNTVNGPTNPAVQGSVLQIFGTGQGYIPGAPPDGTATPGPLSTPNAPFVIIGIDRVDGSAILYSGLAPGLVGVWQVNVQIPLDVITTPTNPTQVIVDLNSVPSGGGGLGRTVLVYVKQRP